MNPEDYGRHSPPLDQNSGSSRNAGGKKRRRSDASVKKQYVVGNAEGFRGYQSLDSLLEYIEGPNGEPPEEVKTTAQNNGGKKSASSRKKDTRKRTLPPSGAGSRGKFAPNETAGATTTSDDVFNLSTNSLRGTSEEGDPAAISPHSDTAVHKMRSGNRKGRNRRVEDPARPNLPTTPPEDDDGHLKARKAYSVGEPEEFHSLSDEEGTVSEDETTYLGAENQDPPMETEALSPSATDDMSRYHSVGSGSPVTGTGEQLFVECRSDPFPTPQEGIPLDSSPNMVSAEEEFTTVTKKRHKKGDPQRRQVGKRSATPPTRSQYTPTYNSDGGTHDSGNYTGFRQRRNSAEDISNARRRGNGPGGRDQAHQSSHPPFSVAPAADSKVRNPEASAPGAYPDLEGNGTLKTVLEDSNPLPQKNPVRSSRSLGGKSFGTTGLPTSARARGHHSPPNLGDFISEAMVQSGRDVVPECPPSARYNPRSPRQTASLNTSRSSSPTPIPRHGKTASVSTSNRANASSPDLQSFLCSSANFPKFASAQDDSGIQDDASDVTPTSTGNLSDDRTSNTVTVVHPAPPQNLAGPKSYAALVASADQRPLAVVKPVAHAAVAASIYVAPPMPDQTAAMAAKDQVQQQRQRPPPPANHLQHRSSTMTVELNDVPEDPPSAMPASTPDAPRQQQSNRSSVPPAPTAPTAPHTAAPLPAAPTPPNSARSHTLPRSSKPAPHQHSSTGHHPTSTGVGRNQPASPGSAQGGPGVEFVTSSASTRMTASVSASHALSSAGITFGFDFDFDALHLDDGGPADANAAARVPSVTQSKTMPDLAMTTQVPVRPVTREDKRMLKNLVSFADRGQWLFHFSSFLFCELLCISAWVLMCWLW